MNGFVRKRLLPVFDIYPLFHVSISNIHSRKHPSAKRSQQPVDKNLGREGKSELFFFFLSKINLFYFYLFLAALGLRCCTQAFSCCGEQGLLFVVVCGRLIAVASLVKHGL